MKVFDFYYAGFRTLYTAMPRLDGRIGVYCKGKFTDITFPKDEFEALMKAGKIVKAHMEENDEVA